MASPRYDLIPRRVYRRQAPIVDLCLALPQRNIRTAKHLRFQRTAQAGVGIRETVIESNPYRTVLYLDQAQKPSVPAAVRPLVLPVLEHVD